MRALIQKYFSHPMQAIAVYAAFFVVRSIPIDIASAIGGKLARLVGPFMKVNKLARENLQKAFPEKSSEEIETILKGVWDNFGRTAFEMPHVQDINIYDHPDRFEVVNAHMIEQMRDDDQCGIFFSGHLANWEFSASSAAQYKPPLYVDMIYRAPDNPWVKKIYDKRQPEGCRLIPKGVKGARLAMQSLQEGRHLAILVDQKMNDGIEIPFFGRPAMTAPAMAQFALRFKCPIVPMRMERLDGAKFRLTFYPALEIPNSGNKNEDIKTIMCEVNRLLEEWIRERPEQWLWLHRRWPKD